MALLLGGAGALEAQMVNPNGPLRIEVIAAPNFVVDSNIQTPAGQSPRSAFIGAVFHNDGTTDLTNLIVRIGNWANGLNPTPGIYPARSHAGLTGPLAGGQFALAHEGGAAGLTDATRKLGTLKAGESLTVYWLISYPLLDVNREPVFGDGPDPSDDLWLTYDIWASALQDNTSRTAAQTTRCTMRNEISAMANKIFPNTANQVPQEYQNMLNQYEPAWTNIAADGTVGTKIMAEGIWYMLGNVGFGYDCDNDLVFDHDAWLQPVGNPALFDAGFFRLVRTHTLLIVKLKDGGEMIITDRDRLYFKDLPENTAVVGYVRYEFAIIQPNGASQLTPYQEAASGSNNEKFNADYGVNMGNPMVGLAAQAALDKTASVSNAVPGQAIQYTIAFTNYGEVAMGDPDTRNPLVIRDRIPAGSLYLAGSATASNTPAAGTTGYTVMFSTNSGASWQETEPSVASNVTDIQWWMNGEFPTQGFAATRFSVQVANPYREAPLLVNTAELGIGDNPPFLRDDAWTRILGNNSLGDTVFADDGAGGAFLGNGAQGGSEPGISNVLVTLYYDANTNGAVDGSDLFIGSTRTGTNGLYRFTNLVDGVYLAIVNPADPAIPAGYAGTTSNLQAVALDPARSSTGAVTVLTADFGFAPALSLSKQPVTNEPLYEGRLVTYAIAVTNNLPGNGLGGPAPVTYTLWASNLHVEFTSTGWLTQSNAVGAPDGRVSTDAFISNPNDYLALNDFRIGAPVGTISNVQVLVPVQVVAPWRAGDVFSVTLVDAAGTEFFRSSYTGHTAVSTGTLTFDVTSVRAWQWSDFNSTGVCIRTVATKGGTPAAGGFIAVDAAGFRVRSTTLVGGSSAATILNPVPLTDRFNPALLQYVSATPSPSAVSTNGGTGTLVWNNLGPLYPGGGRTVIATFKALQPPANTATLATNAAWVTNAFFQNGLPSNPGFSQAVTNLLPTGVIGDTIWRDLNRDGVQQTNEAGIANVKVVLQPPANVNLGAGPGVALTNTTDRNGFYLFEGIADTGRYVVLVLTNTLPAGAINTYTEMNGTVAPSNVTVVTNLFPASTTGLDVRRTADFGYDWSGATIAGQVWNDLNRNGTAVRDAGEAGFSNVWVFLYSGTNTAVALASNRTDAAGFYSFTGPYTGAYTVAVNTNSGAMGGSSWLQTFDTDGLASAGRVTVSVAANGTAYADFSYFQTGAFAIGDTLFYDWNGNGIQDETDEGIPGVPIALYRDLNGNGAVDAGLDVRVAVTNTGAQGQYLFPDYPAGTFLVEVLQWAPAFPTLASCTADPTGAKDGVGVAVLTNTNNLAMDFGYQPFGSGSIGDTVWRDLNADGVQSGSLETGITNVTVRLFADMNGDGTWVLLASTNTGASGKYLFSNLPAGSYRVSVDAGSSALPRDSFGSAFVPTTATNVAVSLTGTTAYLAADFGFAALGAVGDTIFWDHNANGTQDWNEPGITGVTVNLYRDVNGNGLYDEGSDTAAGSRTTGSNGLYLFPGLTAGHYVVAVATNSGPVTNAVLTAAPALDGQPLTNASLQSLYLQYGMAIGPGVVFLGADFGFQPPGVLGETVWLDSDADGIRDAGEMGIANVPVVLSNAVMAVTNRTDADGYYSFGGIADGTYWMQVITNAATFPAGVAPTYDPDGTGTASRISSIVVSNGHVVAVDGVARTNFDMSLNFGYRYAGANTLSGTVGLDGNPLDGVMGTGPSGVSADESAFAGRTVYLYAWRDTDADDAIDSLEAVLIATTRTATNGDYAFTSLPDTVGAGTNRYIVSLAAPDEGLILITTNGSTPALRVVASTNASGECLSAYQVVAIAPAVTNIDFAFQSAIAYDFGDLPGQYGTSLGDNPDGARHSSPPEPVLYLGSGLSTEYDGQPSPTAQLDPLDDGVSIIGPWRDGAAGGLLQVRVGLGSGWLVGYIDFDGDGAFTSPGEMVVNRAVSEAGGDGSGIYTLPVNVPAGTVAAAANTKLYARFRLFTEAPAFPAFAYAQSADGGEVEDYLWDLGSVGDTVWLDTDRDGVRDGAEPPLAGVRVYADLNSNGVWSADEPAAVTDTNGLYAIGGLPAGTYRVAVETGSLPADVTGTYEADATLDGRTDVALADGQVLDHVDFGYDYPDAAVRIVKTAGAAADGAICYAPYGAPVVYRFLVVNDGATHLTDLAVTDDVLGSVGFVAGPLAPGDSVTLDLTNASHTASVTNIATVTATPAHADGSPMAGLGDVQDSDDAVALLATEIRGVVWKENLGIIDGVRTNDLFYPDILVRLVQGGTDGVAVATATTDVNGAFAFTQVAPLTNYTVWFTVSKSNTLYKYYAPSTAYVMADGDGRSSIGNDAVFQGLSSNDAYAVASIAATQLWLGAVVYVDAGLGTNDPTHTLSTELELRLYETADGTFIEMGTVDEVVDGEPITIYLQDAAGNRRQVGQVISRGGSQRYWIPIPPGLLGGTDPVTVVVVDESGATHVLDGVCPAEFKARLGVMRKTGITLTWDSLPGRFYDVYHAPSLGAGWRKVVVNVEAQGTTCSTIVPAGGKQGFWKIVMQEP